MIPQAYITEWRQNVPWQTNEQAEQDLIICRSLVELFSDDWLASSLAFRGGTALHKLYILSGSRYSEDIDLVQISSEPFGPVIDRIRERLSFLGKPKRSPKLHNYTLTYRFESEFYPKVNLRLKIETNIREHFSVLGLRKIPFEVKSSWFEGKCDLTSYAIEELLGSKLRALYQRSKGRDLYDIFCALTSMPDLDIEELVRSYRAYMAHSVERPPSRKEFLLNLESKIKDSEFTGDTTALLRPDFTYDPNRAFELVKNKLIENI